MALYAFFSRTYNINTPLKEI
ncbi:hypothetical protein PENSOL_c126G09907 [Penicillium solitum]|uniref:Uncharacterized protein n=1 Tax=Penicillium solitum TaxID=60172 RepID=A0A1V6Q4K8_9EURO|nr:hypothetical protein PENSOL_c126G09907 [Penicillium solitum]